MSEKDGVMYHAKDTLWTRLRCLLTHRKMWLNDYWVALGYRRQCAFCQLLWSR